MGTLKTMLKTEGRCMVFATEVVQLIVNFAGFGINRPIFLEGR